MLRARKRGFTLVELLVVVAIIGILIALLLPAIQAAREAGRKAKCSNNLHQLAIAAHSYHESTGHFPGGRLLNSNGTSNVGAVKGSFRPWSPQARLMPYMDAASLMKQVQYDDGSNPMSYTFLRQMQPPQLLCPSDTNRLAAASVTTAGGTLMNDDELGKQNYKGCAGSRGGLRQGGRELNNGIFITNKEIKIAEIIDGTSKTLMWSEAVLGDGDDTRASCPGDWFQADAGVAMSEAWAYELAFACAKLMQRSAGSNDVPPYQRTDYKSPGKQFSYSGRNWILGNYIPSRFNSIMPPNTVSCFFSAQQSSQQSSDDSTGSINNQGCATTASSRHPGGVNVAFADGSTRFVPERINVELWWAWGSRNNGKFNNKMTRNPITTVGGGGGAEAAVPDDMGSTTRISNWPLSS